MSNMIEKLKVTGFVELIDGSGAIAGTANLVVDSGKEWIAARMSGVGAPASHIAVGTGTVAANADDVTMGIELFRKAITVLGGTPSDAMVVFETTFIGGEGTGPVTEVGLFDAASGGTLVARTVFPVYNKGSTDLLTVRWTITIS